MRLPLPDIALRPPRPGPRRVLNVAHRGASDAAPENTLAAVEHAAAAGADMVEIDVQRSKDGVPVLFHDTTLVRTTDVRRVFPGRAPWRVGDLTYDELRRLDAGSWKSPQFAGEPPAALVEALETAWAAGVGVLLELKAPELYPGIVADVIAGTRAAVASGQAPAADRLVVQSFSFAATKEHKALAPAVPVGLLGAPPAAHLPALATWADQVNPHHRAVDRAYVARLQDLGLRCQVWTVNRQPAMERALRLGVDGVITNRPGAFARVAGDRGPR